MKFIPVNTPVLNKQEKNNVIKCLKDNQITNGDYINKFETSFAKIHSKKFGVTVSNGTAALEIAIRSLKLKKNSEVIIPNFSIISTALCVIRNNLKPVLIDCDISTWNANAEDIISKINKKTSAIIITHIYGLPVDMSKILKISKKKNIKIVEDTAEVIGLKYKNKLCGSFGDVSIFSFYANKHITTGEGGMILTNNKNIYERCKSFKNLCFSNSYFNRFNHKDLGWNYRMSNLQAAIGFGQLSNLKKIVKTKEKIGNKYYKSLLGLKNISIQPNNLSYAKNIYWVFGIVLTKKLVNKRNNIMSKLLKLGIETRPFFFPMHMQSIFRQLKIFNNNDKYPNSKYISNNGFYIPSGIGLKNNEINYIINSLKKVLN
jgi:perosamine synthetase